jgi:hypothetical protein
MFNGRLLINFKRPSPSKRHSEKYKIALQKLIQSINWINNFVSKKQRNWRIKGKAWKVLKQVRGFQTPSWCKFLQLRKRLS